MDGKIWLIPAALVLGAAGGLARSAYERDNFVVEESVIVSKKIKKEKKLVFLSDLHDKEFGPGNGLLLDAIEEVHPDAVLIGGDTMTAKRGKLDLGPSKRLIQGLTGICPVYYANGNHEQRMREQQQVYGNSYHTLRSILDRYGVIYLADRSVDIGEDLTVSGLDIADRYYRDFKPDKMEAGYVRSHLGEAREDRYQILLAHTPMFFDAYSKWGADLTLSGHFHGGTIRLPFLGGVMTPQFQFFLPWCAGTFEKNSRYMIVSRGLGTHSINIRFLNKPQVVVIRLIPQ